MIDSLSLQMENVLFASDFSTSSERALDYAVDLVERAGTYLQFMYVEEISMGPFVGGEPSPEVDEGQLEEQVLERCRDALKPFSLTLDGDRVSVVVERRGAVAPAIVEFAEENDVDLIAMGTHGRRGVKRVVFGSVAEEVLRTAPCPVLTARVLENEEAPPSGSASVEHVVAPIDFSGPSRSALAYAARLAAVYDAPVTLVHALQLPSVPTVYDVDFPEISPEALEGPAREELEDWWRSVSTEGQDVSYVVEPGDPGPTVLRAASTPGDLVVLAPGGSRD